MAGRMEKQVADEIKYTCCICGKKAEGFGNNPQPIKDKGRCKMKGERYRIGDNVEHEVFGRGVVMNKYNNGLNKVVLVAKFNALQTERNIVANFIGIRRVK